MRRRQSKEPFYQEPVTEALLSQEVCQHAGRFILDRHRPSGNRAHGAAWAGPLVAAQFGEFSLPLEWPASVPLAPPGTATASATA
jgi:hypothetical protein